MTVIGAGEAGGEGTDLVELTTLVSDLSDRAGVLHRGNAGWVPGRRASSTSGASTPADSAASPVQRLYQAPGSRWRYAGAPAFAEWEHVSDIARLHDCSRSDVQVAGAIAHAEFQEERHVAHAVSAGSVRLKIARVAMLVKIR